MAKNNITSGGGKLTTKEMERRLDVLPIHLHEILDLRREIVKTNPLHWGARVSWSLFCVACGPIIKAMSEEKEFDLLLYLSQHPLLLAVLCLSGAVCVALFIVFKTHGRPVEIIDRILDQSGYVAKKG